MYLGLLRADKTEPAPVTGYQRVCVLNVPFALMPPHLEGFDYSIINERTITFPRAVETWGAIHYAALFVDPDSPKVAQLLHLGSAPIIPKDLQASFQPGTLQFAVKGLS